MGRIVAVDGGNTKTVAVVADTDGTVRGVATAGCSDIYGARSVEAALEELVAAVEGAVAAASGAGASGAVSPFAASAFSLAGADWPEDIEFLEHELSARLPVTDPLVVNDAIGALRSGSPGWEGIAVVCGTFNAVGARNADGRVFHLGFWPDRTGAFDLSAAALKAVYRESLGLGPATELTPRALAMYGAADPMDLLHRFTMRGHLGRGELVRMARVLLDVADEGDAVAIEEVGCAGQVLGDQARVAADRVGLALHGTTVVFSGGVLSHPTSLLFDSVMSRLPGAIAVRNGIRPVVGAVCLALDRAGADADTDDLADQIEAWLPGARRSSRAG